VLDHVKAEAMIERLILERQLAGFQVDLNELVRVMFIGSWDDVDTSKILVPHVPEKVEQLAVATTYIEDRCRPVLQEMDPILSPDDALAYCSITEVTVVHSSIQ